MNVFESVKENVTARQAAEMYGIRVNRNGMACCLFHDDKHPGMKVDKRFHCFGCQENGDIRMDLRIERTRRSIINAFIELRAKKPLEKITLNGTFYYLSLSKVVSMHLRHTGMMQISMN